MKKTQRYLAILLAFVLLMSACSTTAPDTASTTEAPAANNDAAPAQEDGGDTAASTGTSEAAPASDNVATGGDDNIVYIGIVCATTGTNKATGEMAYNAAHMAADEINAAGGILGKQIELVHADEIDNLQASVNACNRLLGDSRISALIGSQYSQNSLAVLPAIEEAKMPYIACGSNNAIAEANNPYVWQHRNHDNMAGYVLAEYAYETLGIKNPAFMFSTLPNHVIGGEAMIEIYEQKGIEISDSKIFSYPQEEKNFAPIITQIMNSGADGLLCFDNQQPFALISKAIGDAGLDIPKLANATVTSSIVITNAGKAADGWYSCPDWAPYIDTEVGSKFQASYKEKFGIDTETPSAATYDAVYLIKAAMENANSTVDREAINQGFTQIQGLQGVLGTFNSRDDHTFLDEMFFTKTEDGKAVLIDTVKYR